jgi:RND superfamily putative drug exporter
VNWWLPGWLDQLLPHLHVEPPEAARPKPAGGPLVIPAQRAAAQSVSAY